MDYIEYMKLEKTKLAGCGYDIISNSRCKKFNSYEFKFKMLDDGLSGCHYNIYKLDNEWVVMGDYFYLKGELVKKYLASGL
jgi:hypothetical protein